MSNAVPDSAPNSSGATTTRFDLVVIGGGPGGYVASIRAAQLGMRVACIDERGELGGTCLNVGCIPSKALLHSSEHFAFLEHEAAIHGIDVSDVRLDLGAMMARKRSVVADLGKGIAYLLEKNHVEFFPGRGQIQSPNSVSVQMSDGSTQRLDTSRVLVATGSSPISLPGVEFDDSQIVSSTGALSLESVPEHLVVIGAGVIGLELGSVWSRLGARVTVLEALDHILPGMDREIAKHAQKSLAKQGLDFRLGARVQEILRSPAGVTLEVEATDGARDAIDADVVLISVGRRPVTTGFGLEEMGVARDARGFIQVDASFESNVPGIFAIGDCVPGPMLAHKAEEDGVACVECMAGQAGHVDYARVPGVVYTSPEIAGVGLTQEELDAAETPYSVGKFPFTANSRARATGETAGLVKMLVAQDTGRILGCHLIGPMAGDLLQEIVAVMEFGGTAEDVARICHAHPSMGEAIRESALAALKRAIHI